MKMIYRGEQVEVLEQSGSLSKIRDSHDNEYSVKTDKLKPVPAIRLGGRSADYLAAVKDGLTRFETVDTFLRDEPNLDSPEFTWLKNQIMSRNYLITVYATVKNAATTAKTLASLTGVTEEQALPFITVRERTGGSKWNVDFPNFPELMTAERDAIGVNFGHYSPAKQKSDIRGIRIGSTKLVQALVQEGFAITKFAEKVQEGSCN